MSCWAENVCGNSSLSGLYNDGVDKNRCKGEEIFCDPEPVFQMCNYFSYKNVLCGKDVHVLKLWPWI